MPDDPSRTFALRHPDGTETSVFSGKQPRHAALKAARWLDAASSEAEASREELRLRERGTTKLHVYEGWAWENAASDNKPDWLPERITEANVAKQGVEHLDEL
jgi:hypothetical protein